MNNLNLPENLLLLALNDESGERYTNYVDYALAGAAFAELILREKLIPSPTKKGRFELAESTPTGDIFIDRCFGIVKKKGVGKDPKHLISAIGATRRVSAPLVDGLVRRGTLHRRTKKVFFFFEKTIHPEADPAAERTLKQHLERVLFENHTPTPEDTVLIALTKELDILKHNFDRDLLKSNRDRIKQIASGDHLAAGATRKAIEAVRAAVMVAVIVPAVILPAT